MQFGRIEADPGAVDEVARSCGSLAVACTAAAGRIGNVSDSLTTQLSTLGELEAVTEALEREQRSIADATAEARSMTLRARETLDGGRASITQSMTEFEEVTALVGRLGEQMTGFAAAMRQVRKVTEGIDAIARTTNMLALNAAIEAERAGEAGRSFAVVAAEVKALAGSTRAAVEEVAAVIGSLDREAGSIVAEIAGGAAQSRAVQGRFAEINRSVADVGDLVGLVERQSDMVAEGTSTVLDSVRRVRGGLKGFARDARDNGTMLAETRGEVAALERLSNRMFDRLVHSGFSRSDARYVELALAGAAEVTTIVEAALAAGAIRADDVFDTDYRPIAGSDPVRYDNRFADFADRMLQPLLDRFVATDPLIYGCVCSDRNGYLPTHISRAAQSPRDGDRAFNDKYCRNRRMVMDDATARAVESEAGFQMAVYRHDSDRDTTILKNVFVPLRFAGRRWGNFEIAYLEG